MPQNQEQIEARLAAYIDGELDANERAEIEKHLVNNPQHKQLIEELMGQRDFLRALPREKAPPEIAETIHSQLERSVLLGKAGEDTEAAALRINRWPHRGAIAAIVLLTAGLGFLVYKVLPSNKPPAEFAVAPRELSPATAPLTEVEKAEKPTEVAVAGKEAEKSLPAPAAPTPAPSVTPEPAPAPSVALAPAPTPSPAPAPSVALAPAPAPTPSPAPAPERMSKTADTTDIAAATPPASQPPANPSAPPPINIGVDTLPGTVPPAGAPTTPSADASNKEDQGKIAAPTSDALAMKNGAVFNDAAAGNQPLANAMKSGEGARKGGESNVPGGFGGGGGGAGQQQSQFGAGLASANGSITLVVSTDDPSVAGEQVKAYCVDNGIAWEPTAAPASIAYAQQDYTRMNRLRSQQVTVSSGQPMAKGMPDERYRYAAKDVQGNRRTEMQSLDRGGALSDQSNAKKEPATQPSVADADALAKQSAPSLTMGPSTQPASVAQPAQTRDDVAAEHLAFYCRAITPEQAHALEGVLSARPGQSAQVLPQSLAVDRTLDLNLQAGALPTTAPSTQATAGSIAQNEQPAAPSDGSTMKEQLALPADKLGNANGNFDLKQGPVQQQQAAQQPAVEQRVDLLVVVRRDASAATQPTQQQLESPPINAAEPVRQEPATKSP